MIGLKQVDPDIVSTKKLRDETARKKNQLQEENIILDEKIKQNEKQIKEFTNQIDVIKESNLYTQGSINQIQKETRQEEVRARELREQLNQDTLRVNKKQKKNKQNVK